MGYSYVEKFSLGGTSPAAASTAASTTITGLEAFKSLTFYCVLTGATGGTLDIYIQWSPDLGTTWVDYAHFAQLADGAAAIKRFFSVSRYGQQTTVTAVGSGTTASPGVALAANTVLGGDFGDRLRVVYVAGGGTSAGAAQIINFVGKT